MPSSERILRELSLLAHHFLLVAVAWHALVLAIVVGIGWFHWRPSRRTAVLLLSLPLLSVSGLAWATGNPFNGTTFALFTAASLAIAPQVPREPATPGPEWAVALGGAALVYAWVYPHFLESRPWALYLIASPMGLVPCPTLSMVLGFGLVGGGLGSRAWSLTMGAAGFFYAFFGMFRLGVLLDAGLLGASAAMVGLWFASPRRTWKAARSGAGQ